MVLISCLILKTSLVDINNSLLFTGFLLVAVVLSFLPILTSSNLTTSPSWLLLFSKLLTSKKLGNSSSQTSFVDTNNSLPLISFPLAVAVLSSLPVFMDYSLILLSFWLLFSSRCLVAEKSGCNSFSISVLFTLEVNDRLLPYIYGFFSPILLYHPNAFFELCYLSSFILFYIFLIHQEDCHCLSKKQYYLQSQGPFFFSMICSKIFLSWF